MVKKVLVAVILVALFAVAIVSAMESDGKQQSNQKIGLEVGNIAPDFELKTLSGESVKLSQYQGKKVILNFWATWCPPCKAEIPEMQNFYKDKKGNIEILAVNIDTTNDVAGFAKKMGITFPVLLDEKNEINKTYGIVSIPTTYFIDEKGVITHKFIGSMKQDDMEKYTK